MKLRVSSLVWSVSAVLIAAQGAVAGQELLLRSGKVSISDSISASAGVLPAADSSANVFVAQWSAPVDASLRRSLEQRGFEILRYLPQDALILSRAGVAVSAHELGARALAPVAAEWKIAPGLLTAPERSNWVLVSVFRPEWMAKAMAGIRAIDGVKVLRADSGELAVSATPSQIEKIAAMDAVEWVQELPIWTSMDYAVENIDVPAPAAPPEFTGYESGTKIMGFEAAWARGLTGKGQFVAMADTGVDTGNLLTLHVDLRPVVAKGYALGIGAKEWADPQGHGTHVCGSVVGMGAASSGRLKGGAFEATMLPGSIWSPIMDNLAFPSDFNKLFGPSYQDGARVHTNSWGSPRAFGEYDAFASSVDKYVWEHPDFMVLFAAGNSGEDKNADGRIDANSIGSPGTSKNVLTVGASENLLAVGGIQKPIGQLRDGDKKWGVEPIKSDMLSNNPNGMAAFSSRGPTTDGRLKPEIVAPGTNIVSTRSHHPRASTLWGIYDEEYVYAGGTSMATPLTAGAAVVTRQYLMERAGVDAPSAALIKATLMHSAFDMYPGQYGFGTGQELPKPRPNIHEGYGRVDLDTLTTLADHTAFVDEKDGVSTGGNKEVSFSLGNGKGLRATLVYTDAPASPSAGKALVNDLDLEVVDPSGAVSSLKDSTNNAEMIELKPGLARGGDYRIRVVGKNVPQGRGVTGKLPYALVISTID